MALVAVRRLGTMVDALVSATASPVALWKPGVCAQQGVEDNGAFAALWVSARWPWPT